MVPLSHKIMGTLFFFNKWVYNLTKIFVVDWGHDLIGTLTFIPVENAI
jgi:hypothetical protein